MRIGWNGDPLPLLTYHSIDDDRSILSTSPAAFRQHIQFLSSHSFRSIRLSELADLLHKKLPLPPKHVCLTFDDGYQNVYSDAFPVLEEHGFTATVFVVAGYCGRYNDWPGNLRSLKRAPLLSWNQLKEMTRFGIECGSHTLTHPDLTRIPVRHAEEEIIQSKREIEDKTGQSVTLFAYPYGSYNSGTRAIVRGHFGGACSTRLGNVRTGADPYAIRRIDSCFVSNIRRFSKLTTGALAGYLQARQVLRDLKTLL